MKAQKIQFEKIGRSLVIKFDGEIDHHYAEDIRNKIDHEFNKQNCKNIIFDFTNVTFMDSSGIGMIIGRYKLAKEKNGTTFACSLKDNAKKLFIMSGLDKIITYHNTLEEILRTIS